MITKEKSKGNIPIDKELLNKYKNVEEIFDNADRFFENDKCILKLNSSNDILNLDFKNLKVEYLKRLAYKIFNECHDKNTFINNGNNISVTKKGIYESVQKIYNNKYQRELVKENFIIFANLGSIIETALLVNQALERKKRNGIIYWNYYINRLYIDNEEYLINFDVRTLDCNQNQYRIQRIVLKKKKQVA